ncbi:MAG: tetratricopeptide repeat protein [Deltaproteobacteria bacterium]|nr:tetratricopeptide repeat protein [Deltaproteobacteria bacterium]
MNLISLLPIVFLATTFLTRAGESGSQTEPSLQVSSQPSSLATPDPFERFGLSETAGAAPGYVEDRACAFCHTDLFESYQEIGMARSFARPRKDRIVEDFSAKPYFHEPSGRYFQMSWKDDRYVFRRHQLDPAGREVNVFEQPVDWVLGSGSTSRTYLYGTPGGELYQLPLSWYSQIGQWRMAPGYDQPDHEGVTRRVRRECMFCHNAYPEVAAGSDGYWQPQVFPAELPEGTGCQRCHGPGAEHVRLGLQSEVDFEALQQAIVNPARLPRERRNDVCNQCHLQPSVALFGVRRFGQGSYSFRPGQDLAEYQVPIDVEEEALPSSERFEINHHAYRLQQSPCYLKSEGELGCSTCHDPHRKVAPAEKARHYGQACLSCHELDACSREAMALQEGPKGAGQESVEGQSCVACHMPRRRAQDVIHVVMTDHKIQRRPAGEELLAPLKERDPILTEVDLLEKEGAPDGVLGEIYRAIAVIRRGDPSPVDYLSRRLPSTPPEGVEPLLDLAQAQLRLDRLAEAQETLTRILEEEPKEPMAQRLLTLLRAKQGKTAEAVHLMEKRIREDPNSPEDHFNLALQLLRLGQPEKALASLDRSLDLRPNHAVGWFYRGEIQTRLKRYDESRQAYRRALEIDPIHERSYLSLARLHEQLESATEAAACLRLGLANLPGSRRLAQALEALEAS